MTRQCRVKGVQDPADDAVFMFMGGLVPELRRFAGMTMGLFMMVGKMEVQGQGHALESYVKPGPKGPYQIYGFSDEAFFRHGRDPGSVFQI
jgi:hypothetical protein